MDASLLADALAYRSRLGWPLIPLRGKVPYTELLPQGKWKPLTREPATTDDIRAWFAKAGDALNIGLLTGDPSGLAVLDFDVPTPKSFHTAPTITAVTMRGHHYYYRAPRGLKGYSADWGELRANGGYVVVPHSIHPKSGTRYEWAAFLSPWETEPEPLPLEMMRAPRQRHPARQETEESISLSPLRGEISQVKNILYLRQKAVGLGEEGWIRAACTGDNLIAWLRRVDVVEKAAEVLGIPAGATSGKPFRCILPGHADEHPSASLYRNQSGVFVYRDWHRAEGPEWLTLGDVRAALAYGKVKLLRSPERAVWTIRLLVEAGAVRPVEVPWAGTLPPEAPGWIHAVYAGFLVLLGCKWTHTLDEPTPYSWRFASAWCDVPEYRVREAMRELLRHRYIVKRREHGRMALFDAGPGDGRPYAQWQDE